MSKNEEVSVEDMLKVMKKEERAEYKQSVMVFFMTFFVLVAILTTVLTIAFSLISMPASKMALISSASLLVTISISAAIAIYHWMEY